MGIYPRNITTAINNFEKKSSPLHFEEVRGSLDVNMKRIKKICLTILLSLFGLFLFTACTSKENVDSISLNGYSEEMPLQLRVGKFSYDEYTLTVAYDDGSTKEIALQEDMISETDKLKFFQEGKSEISISYQGAVTTVWIDVARNVFPENVQFKSVMIPYTGEDFTVEVEGDIPINTKILYPQGNTFKEVGKYDRTAILQCEGYVTKILSATIVVERAMYDVSTATFKDMDLDTDAHATFIYDKEAHGIKLQGKEIQDANGTTVAYEPASFPQGIWVNYTITKIIEGDGVTVIPPEKQKTSNGYQAIDAGTYIICAQFEGEDERNYHPIPDAIARLTIERGEYDMSDVTLKDATFVYTGETYSLTVETNGKTLSDVKIDYQIKMVQNSKGEDVTEEYEDGNSRQDAGVYSVKAIFTIEGKNAVNYETNPCEIEGQLTILRAEYDSQMQKLYLDSQWQEFQERKEYVVWLSGDLPAGIEPHFTLTNEAGEEIIGQMEKVSSENFDGSESIVNPIYKYVFTVPEEGHYACVVTFTHTNENYKDIQLKLEAWIFIDSNQ